MPRKIILHGVFQGQNLEVKNIDSNLRVRTHDDSVVVVVIIGLADDLLNIRVTSHDSIIVIEGNGNEDMIGLEKMTVIGRIHSRHGRKDTKIDVRVPRGGRVELASTFSGNTEIDEGIRVAKEIE